LWGSLGPLERPTSMSLLCRPWAASQSSCQQATHHARVAKQACEFMQLCNCFCRLPQPHAPRNAPPQRLKRGVCQEDLAAGTELHTHSTHNCTHHVTYLLNASNAASVKRTWPPAHSSEMAAAMPTVFPTHSHMPARAIHTTLG
jgi:hypothetical protein